MSRLILIPAVFFLIANFVRAVEEPEAVALDVSDLPISVKCKLSSLDGKEPGPLRRFETTIDGASTQALKDGGIRLTITVHNKSNSAALIENPLDYLTYALRNSSGQMVGVPRPKARDEIQSLKDKTREPRKLAFKVLSMKLNEKALDEKEIDEDTLTMPAGSKLSFQIQIDTAAQAPYAKPEDAVIVELAPGRYSLQLRTTILLHREDGSAWFDSPGIQDPACVRVKVK